MLALAASLALNSIERNAAEAFATGSVRLDHQETVDDIGRELASRFRQRVGSSNAPYGICVRDMAPFITRSR